MVLYLLLGVVGFVDALLKGLINRVELIPYVGRGLLQQVVGNVDVLIRLDSFGHRSLNVIFSKSCPSVWTRHP